MECTLHHLIEAIKVPVILRKERPAGLVIGSKRFAALRAWAEENDHTVRGYFDNGGTTPLGVRLLVTDMYPETLFAVTESELPAIVEKLERCHSVSAKPPPDVAACPGLKIYGDPVVCPWCKGEEIEFMTGWPEMRSSDDQSTVLDLDEYQCSTCNGRSFWV